MSESPRRWSTRRRIIIGLAVVLGVGVVYLGLAGFQAFLAWHSIDRVEFDTEAARVALVTIPTSTMAVESEDSSTPPSTQDPNPILQQTEYQAFLVIGSDEKPPELQEGIFADAVLLYLAPTTGDPILVSLPRDLLVTNPCTSSPVKLNSLLAGCDDAANGPELIAIAVENLTGIAVDHFGVVEFEGLVRAVDEIGGIELCSENALRGDDAAGLLPEGCSRIDGSTALRYVRSRTTQEFVDGEWIYQEGTSDLTRAERQQDVLLAMLSQAKSVRSPDALADLISKLSDAVVLDDGLSMGNAVDLAWELRGTPPEQIRRLVLPVEPVVTEDGQFALRATTPFLDVIA